MNRTKHTFYKLLLSPRCEPGSLGVVSRCLIHPGSLGYCQFLQTALQKPPNIEWKFNSPSTTIYTNKTRVVSYNNLSGSNLGCQLALIYIFVLQNIYRVPFIVPVEKYIFWTCQKILPINSTLKINFCTKC